MRTRCWSSMVAVGVMLSPALATAQGSEPKPIPECTHEPTDADVAAAKAAFQAGNASFNEADYPRAILYWEDAYRRDCTAHALLLNLARAYELNNQNRQAVVSLQAFLARQPDTPQKEQILRRIEVLNRQIEQEQQRAAAPPPSSPAQRVANPGTPPPAAPLQTPPPAPADTRTRRRSIVPLLVAGGGAVVAATGGVLYIVATNQADGYENDPPPDGCGGNRKQCDPRAVANGVLDRANGAVTRQTIGSVLTWVGVGAIAGGLLWYVLQEPEPVQARKPAPKVALDPRVGRGFAGLSVAGSF